VYQIGETRGFERSSLISSYLFQTIFILCLFTFYAHKPTTLGTKIILYIRDDKNIVKLRLTQYSWIRTYKFYYFDAFLVHLLKVYQPHYFKNSNENVSFLNPPKTISEEVKNTRG